MFGEVSKLRKRRGAAVALVWSLSAMGPVVVVELGKATVELRLALTEAARVDPVVWVLLLWLHEMQY